jgi:benzylsuccinate CoA-transferase BbsF subunit
MPDALRGLRILEMGIAVAGPTAAHILGDMGASVIKIEEPRVRAHVPAATPPPVEGALNRPQNRVVNFNELNRSKRQLPLDVGAPEGRQIFLELTAQSDVVIENFAPRVMGNLGIDYADLAAVNPAIILVSMPAFGKTGPYRDRISYGPGIDAMTGISHLTGYPDAGPGKPGNFFCDQNAGLHAIFCILTALRHRRRTGEGQYIELSMLEGELQFVAPAVIDVIMNGRADQMRIGNRHAWLAPQGVYPCAGDDAWVAISVATDEQWRALCEVIGQPALASDPAYATAALRQDRHAAIDVAIEAWTSGRDKFEAHRVLQRAGVPAGAALDQNDLFEDPQLMHRGSFSWVEHPEVGPFPHTPGAWRSRRGNHGVSAPAFLFGHDIDDILIGLLGRTEAEVADLVAREITAYEPVGWRALA